MIYTRAFPYYLCMRSALLCFAVLSCVCARFLCLFVCVCVCVSLCVCLPNYTHLPTQMLNKAYNIEMWKEGKKTVFPPKYLCMLSQCRIHFATKPPCTVIQTPTLCAIFLLFVFFIVTATPHLH